MAETTTITVKAGDTLWDIAERELGDPQRWTQIWSMNSSRLIRARQGVRRSYRYQSPDWIFPGETLELPHG